jgi:hypothetical protein
MRKSQEAWAIRASAMHPNGRAGPTKRRGHEKNVKNSVAMGVSEVYLA